MDIVFTAAMFSILSFSASKLFQQWKETGGFRKAKRELKLKESAISIMSSKELFDAAKNKDKENFKRLAMDEQEIEDNK